MIKKDPKAVKALIAKHEKQIANKRAKRQGIIARLLGSKHKLRNGEGR